MADLLANEPAGLSKTGAPTPTIVEAIAYVPALSKVTQEVQTATINEEIKGARMRVGVRVKAKAHKMLGTDRANVLFNERATSAYVYGNVVRAAGKQTWRVLVDLDKSEVDMYRNNLKIVQPNAGVVAPEEDAENESDLDEEDGDEILGVIAPDAGPLQDAENNKIVAHDVTWTFGDDVAVDITEEDDRQHKEPAKILNFDFRGERMFRNFFWHLFPGTIEVRVAKANQYIDENETEMPKITEQEFENFWGLILLGCLCGGGGENLWLSCEDDIFQRPNFTEYMTYSRFKQVKKVPNVFPCRYQQLTFCAVPADYSVLFRF
jgi:hypothetical protein